MQSIQILLVGKTDSPPLQSLIAQYLKRLNRFVTAEIVEIPDLKNTKAISAKEQKEKEGQLILAHISPSDYIVLLDERGKEFTSLNFANYLNHKQQVVARRLVFVVGGPYGFSAAVYNRATEQVSLSKMTFSHQMVRLFLVEQIYRAFTILTHHPYHHE